MNPPGAKDGLVLDLPQCFKRGMKGARTPQWSPLFDSPFWESAQKKKKNHIIIQLAAELQALP